MVTPQAVGAVLPPAHLLNSAFATQRQPETMCEGVSHVPRRTLFTNTDPNLITLVY